MKASDVDREFDEGGSVLEWLQTVLARRPNLEHKRVNLDFPVWIIESLWSFGIVHCAPESFQHSRLRC